jgi:hypothetical protein
MSQPEPAISPATRLLLMSVRRSLLSLVAAIDLYLGLKGEKKEAA